MPVETIEAGYGAPVFLKADVGRHDFLYAPRSQESFLIQHGEPEHKNCLTNIANALAHIGVAIEFTARMDLAIALTACPTLSCNGGRLRPLQFEVLK